MLKNTIIKDIKPEQRIVIQEKLFSEGNTWKNTKDNDIVDEKFNLIDIDDIGGVQIWGTRPLTYLQKVFKTYKVITADEYLGQEPVEQPTMNIKQIILKDKIVGLLELSKEVEAHEANQLVEVAISLIKKL